MIGDIIKEQRTSLKMSRNSLSEGICTEKYIYLIEKNERNPSAYILNNLSDRLGIDLFEYYQYLDYEDQIAVAEYKEKFDRYIKSGEVEKLKEASDRASELEDFKHEPLIYDIKIIDLLYKATIKGKISEVIEELTDLLKIEKLNIDNLTLINAYIVLSSCYQIQGEIDKAEKAVDIAYDMTINKYEFSRYSTSVITVMISKNSLLYHRKMYDELIMHSEHLLRFQEKYTEFNRIYYGEFYLSFAYYRTGELQKAKEHFLKGIHSALLFQNKLDIKYILQMGIFNEMIEKLDINQYLIDQLHEIGKKE